MAEFTGERVVPDQVDKDLWNEHLSRYYFASRLCRGKRVLEIGCGSGYGAKELARHARSVIALDIASDALRFAKEHYEDPAIAFLQASGTQLPLSSNSIELIVAFEIIEHLKNWTQLLSEARRVLTPAGQFVVSTPNRDFYAESRRLSGPNPFHEHEFEFEEFRRELLAYFPHVSLFLQNHGTGIVFQPVDAATGAEVHIDAKAAAPEESNFFIAVCASSPQTGAPAFVHVPSAANVLKERSEHIKLLEQELETKNDWLESAKASHEELLAAHRAVTEELQARNQWAEELNTELDSARRMIDQVHADKDAEITALADRYEEKVATLERESEAQSQWALDTQKKLDECAQLLQESQEELLQRTKWAQVLDEEVQRLRPEVEELRARVAMMQASRWVRIGKAIGIGPGAHQK